MPEAYETPVRYRVTGDSYINDRLFKASEPGNPDEGTVGTNVFCDYAGHPGATLEPVEVAANGRDAKANLVEGEKRKGAYYEGKGRTAADTELKMRALTHGADDKGALQFGLQPAPAAPMGQHERDLIAKAATLEERERALVIRERLAGARAADAVSDKTAKDPTPPAPATGDVASRPGPEHFRQSGNPAPATGDKDPDPLI